MELRQLTYFVTVAREGSFTRAAELLHVSQPGVSAQIRQLEKDLGQRLLDRSGRRVGLTPAGEAVLPHARAALAAAGEARRAAQEFGGLQRGHVRLGTVSGAALPGSGALPSLPGLATTLAAFRKEHPGIDLSLAENTTRHLLAELRAGRLDLAVAGLPAPASGRPGDDGWDTLAGLALHPVLEIPLAAVLPHDHPLAADGPLPVAELAGHALVSTPHGTGLRTALERAFAEAGATPAIAVEAAAPAHLLELAAHGMGVAVLPTPTHSPGLRVRPLTSPVPLARIALVHPTDRPRTAPTAALLAHLRKTYPGL
ncbi:LysR family transcriptional regulator [Kitasatospora sp. NPDC057904]|uniref:LysR family transcriptional regulator n=1 Tax=Kitasatospora sp. NPDC057904 TaxID=3346275 RepID=UPI0036DBEB41